MTQLHRKRRTREAHCSPAHWHLSFPRQWSPCQPSHVRKELPQCQTTHLSKWVPPKNVEGLDDVNTFCPSFPLRSPSTSYPRGPIPEPSGKWSWKDCGEVVLWETWPQRSSARTTSSPGLEQASHMCRRRWMPWGHDWKDSFSKGHWLNWHTNGHLTLWAPNPVDHSLFFLVPPCPIGLHMKVPND